MAVVLIYNSPPPPPPLQLQVYCVSNGSYLTIGISGNSHYDCTFCKKTTLGTEFCGQISITERAKTCQRWDSQYPHEHTRNDPSAFPEEVLEDAANYCRNPDNTSEGPWCYTTDPNSRWEYCEVIKCGKYINLNLLMWGYL